jgi:hypothetical protein
VRLLIRNRIIYIRRERGDPQQVVYKNLDSSIFYGEVIFDTSESAVPKRMGLDSSIFYGAILLDTFDNLLPKRKELDSSIFYGDVLFDTSDNATPFRKIFKDVTIYNLTDFSSSPSLKVVEPLYIESVLNSESFLSSEIDFTEDLEVIYDCGVWMGSEIERLRVYGDISSSVISEGSIEASVGPIYPISSKFRSESSLTSTIYLPKDISANLQSSSEIDAVIFRPIDILSSIGSQSSALIDLNYSAKLESSLYSNGILSASISFTTEVEQLPVIERLYTEDEDLILTEEGEELYTDGLILFQKLLTENHEQIITEGGSPIYTEGIIVGTTE